ncbi:hypothetical protein EDD17DRAFT_1514320 [Pisolithus thermaeus]|nr:hypothetical protein EV401DRAFT_1886543 [Pisolithus croceorrhizus]KAI6148176.1 hypothetical protein EDD17DRAFT_1514320 [Pisolithus thermaeus]
MVRNKWVSHTQKIYQDIKGFQGKSGCHWDNMHGAGVHAKLDGAIFESYAKTHPLIHPFKNCGWEYYTLLLDIIHNAENAEWHETVLRNSSAIPSGVRSSYVQSGWATIPTPPSTLLSSTSAFDLPGNIPPSSALLASLRKQVHTEMTGDDNTNSAFLFADMADVSMFKSNKCTQLSAAVDSARNSCSCCSPKVAPPPDPVQGLHSSIDWLTTLLTTSLSLHIEQASITRSHAIQLLDGEDSNLPRFQKAFIWSSIAQSLGFANVYLRTTDKEDQVEYVNLKYQLKFGSSASQAG